jgi:hypothetical protein
MIQTENLTTRVQFGSNGKGTIGLVARSTYTSDGILILQMLNDGVEMDIGARPTFDDLKELPKVVLHFKDTRSIDALIECLHKTKHFMEYPFGVMPYAC